MNCARATVRMQHGFTIMELLITVVIMGILSVVGVSMISDTFYTARVVNASQRNANDARYAVERLAREIREIKYVNKATGYGITTMSPARLVFTRDLGGDVVITIDGTSTNLTLGYGSAASTLVTQAALNLEYLALDPLSTTGATSTTTLATNVRFIVITLTLTDSTSGKQITERSRVALRNMCETNPCT